MIRRLAASALAVIGLLGAGTAAAGPASAADPCPGMISYSTTTHIGGTAVDAGLYMIPNFDGLFGEFCAPAVHNGTGAAGIYAVAQSDSSDGYELIDSGANFHNVTGTAWHTDTSTPGYLLNCGLAVRFSFQKVGHNGTAYVYFNACTLTFSHVDG